MYEQESGRRQRALSEKHTGEKSKVIVECSSSEPHVFNLSTNVQVFISVDTDFAGKFKNEGKEMLQLTFHIYNKIMFH